MATHQELRVLVLEDVASDAELAVHELKRSGFTPIARCVDNREAFVEALERFKPDVVLLDFNLPQFDGRSAIHIARDSHPDLPLVIVTGTLPDESAIELLRSGATDYVLKTNLVRLPTVVRRALAEADGIRNREQAERALREAHALLSKVMDTSPVGITVWDDDGRIAFANPEAKRLLETSDARGLEPSNRASGWRITDFFGNVIPDDAHPYRRVMDTGQPAHDMKMAIVGHDGRRKLISVNAAPLRAESGKISGVIATLEDVTQREAAEEMLRNREAHLRLAMAAAKMGTWTVEIDEQTVFQSEETSDILGLPDRAKTCSLDEFLAQVHIDDRERVSAQLRATIDQERSYCVDYRVVTPDGTIRWLNSTGNLVRDPNGKPKRILGVVWDITARKENELALDRANRSLRVLSAVNQQLIHAEDECSLFHAVCREIVQTGDYCLAWVGAVQHDEQKSVIPVAQFGECKDFVASVKVSWSADNPLGHGPIGSAIRLGTMQLSRDMATDPLVQPWRDQANRHGFRSAIAFPLRDASGVFGALTIYASTADAFACEEIELLQELADDLAFGVAGLRRAQEQRRTEAVLKLHDHAIAESINGILISKASIEEDNPIIYVNPALTNMTGYTVEELLGRNPRLLLREDWNQPDIDHLRKALREGSDVRVTLRNYRKDGSLFWNEISMASVHDEAGKITHFISIFNDITERISYQSELAHQANHDSLTGLANRNLLHNRIEHALARAARTQTNVAVFFIDLDHFKYVNDSLGHAVGDELIKAVARQLSDCAREVDTVARLGGDEFVMLLTDLESDEPVVRVLTRVLGLLSRQYEIDGHEMYVTASIGVSLYPRDGNDSETLLRNADAAMYRAKECGRHRFEFYHAAMNVKARERLSMEMSLRRALKRDELRVHFQPQVDLHSGLIIGAEALVRWQHPELGMIPPMQFIPIAEETGLILMIGEWMLKSVCAQQRAWLDAGLPVPRIAVNLSARQFRQKDLVQLIEHALKTYGLDGGMLEVEIVESAALGDADEAVNIMQKLKALGVRISIDDFGTGYSSLAWLKRFPIDNLKIDRDFVRELTTDPEAAAICLASITLAHSLELAVVAEGVETEGQLHYLRQHRCDIMQGYFFSPPVAADAFARLLSEEAKLALPDQDDIVRRRMLLIVDDEAGTRSSLKRLLRAGGYDVLTASDAAQGLELLAKNPVQVILSDQQMPGMTGIEFLRRARSLYPDTVRIVLSESTDLQSLTASINEGAIYKFLTKPWDDAQLLAQVREAFRHKEMVDDNHRLNHELTKAREALAAANRQQQECVERGRIEAGA